MIQKVLSAINANINAEVDKLHPSTHKFWEDTKIKEECTKSKKAYNKLTIKELNKLTKNYLRGEF